MLYQMNQNQRDLEGSPIFHRYRTGKHYIARVAPKKVIGLVSELNFRERVCPPSWARGGWDRLIF